MRQFINGSGSNTTSAALSYLAANRQLLRANLFVINTAPCYAGQYLGQQFLITDYPSPLLWGYRGTFNPGVISRNEITSKIGLEADSVEVTWHTGGNTTLASSDGAVLSTILQGFHNGVFDNGLVEIWQVLMPTVGDCNTLGACLMFSGRIGDLEYTRSNVKITVLSRLETLNIQIPTNLIEPGNILSQYSAGIIPINGAPSFTVMPGSTPIKIYGQPSGSGYDNNVDTYDFGYIVMGSGTLLGGTYRRIRIQTIEDGYHAFYLTEPLPFAPTVGDTLAAYVPVPVGYSLLPFNELAAAEQVVPDSTTWAFGLNGTNLTGLPNGDSAGGERKFGFVYHDGYTDVYRLDTGGTASGWNDLWVGVNPSGLVVWPGQSANGGWPGTVINQQPPQNEPGVGVPIKSGFPFVPIPINSSINM